MRRVLPGIDGSVRTELGGDAQRFDAWGQRVCVDGACERNFGPGYRGAWHNPDGTIFLSVRVYHPALGVFLQPDPYAGHAASPQTLHRYAYANGDPINYFDPTGYVAEAAPENLCNNGTRAALDSVAAGATVAGAGVGAGASGIGAGPGAAAGDQIANYADAASAVVSVACGDWRAAAASAGGALLPLASGAVLRQAGNGLELGADAALGISRNQPQVEDAIASLGQSGQLLPSQTFVYRSKVEGMAQAQANGATQEWTGGRRGLERRTLFSGPSRSSIATDG